MSKQVVHSAAVVASAVATALVLWALVRLFGVDLEVGRGAHPSQVGALDVLTAALLGGVGAWAVGFVLIAGFARSVSHGCRAGHRRRTGKVEPVVRGVTS